MSKDDIEIGYTFRVPYPFYSDTVEVFDIMGAPELIESWIPGCKIESIAPDDVGLVAEDMGEMLLSVIDRHKPGKYPERVFYTRKWVDPDGKTFGSGALKITTIATFLRRASGYYHEFRVE